MYPFTLSVEANEQRLAEYQAGRANQTCMFPGIRQCFAIVGRRQTFMTCAHISPSTTAARMAEAFQHLRDMGGNWVTSWHVVGPFTNHFGTGSALWKSKQDIKQTFDDEFGGNGASRWILDVSKQRNERITEKVDGMSWTTSMSKIDIRADLATDDDKIRFFYQRDRGAKKDEWTRLYNKSFTRF